MADPDADPDADPAADAGAAPDADAASGRGQKRRGEAVDQYFEAVPSSTPAPRTVAVGIDGMHLHFATESGVFSPDRLDPGTRLLLLEAPTLAAGEERVLDLGCGWGPIACVAALRSPAAEVLAVDVNERALRLTAHNAAANGARQVTATHPDDVDPARRFERILCNPPIRIGKPALQEMLSAWLDRLVPDGRAHMVVHRHLGSDSLAAWLAGRGHSVARLLSRSGYRLLEVGPRAGRSPRPGRPRAAGAGAP